MMKKLLTCIVVIAFVCGVVYAEGPAQYKALLNGVPNPNGAPKDKDQPDEPDFDEEYRAFPCIIQIKEMPYEILEVTPEDEEDIPASRKFIVQQDPSDEQETDKRMRDHSRDRRHEGRENSEQNGRRRR